MKVKLMRASAEPTPFRIKAYSDLAEKQEWQIADSPLRSMAYSKGKDVACKEAKITLRFWLSAISRLPSEPARRYNGAMNDYHNSAEHDPIAEQLIAIGCALLAVPCIFVAAALTFYFAPVVMYNLFGR